jgi:hypothetical protein
MNPSSLTIPQPWLRRYHIARAILFFGFIALALFGCFRLLFPIQVGVFDFNKPDSLSNTLAPPQTPSGLSLATGHLDTDQTLITSAQPIGLFDTADITLTPSRKSVSLEGTTVTLRKSYAAFFYPVEDRPALFPPGTLLRSADTYAIIAPNATRITFASLETVRRLGYTPENFLTVSAEEFSRQPVSMTWDSTTDVPPGTLLSIDGVYYQREAQTLRRFVSENAYLSLYTPDQALTRSADLLNRIPVDEQWLGFADGSLLSFDNGIFVVDRSILRPIGDPTIFVALGFDWARVIPASEEEMGIMSRGRIVLMNTPQPNGTIFLDRDTGEYFLITSDARRQPIRSTALLSILTRHTTPISVSSQALTLKTECLAHSTGWFSSDMSCKTPLHAFQTLPGGSYEITLETPTPGARLDALRIDFHTALRQSSWQATLSLLKQRLLNRYVTP